MLEKYSIIFSNLARPKNNRFSKQINRNERERRIELQNISPRCSRGRPSTRRRREAFWYLYHCFKLRYAQTYYYHNRQQHGIWAMVEGTRVEGERGLIAIMGPESARDRRNGKRLDSRRRDRTIERLRFCILAASVATPIQYTPQGHIITTKEKKIARNSFEKKKKRKKGFKSYRSRCIIQHFKIKINSLRVVVPFRNDPIDKLIPESAFRI